MKFTCLTAQERADTGMNYRLDFDYTDIPTGVAVNTAAVINTAALGLPIIPNGSIIRRSQLHLTTPFEDVSDAAFNDMKISIGDAGSATRFINASQANVNGTEVLNVYPGATENVVYTADSRFQITFGSMAAKTVSDIDKGKAYFLYGLDNTSAVLREDKR